MKKSDFFYLSHYLNEPHAFIIKKFDENLNKEIWNLYFSFIDNYCDFEELIKEGEELTFTFPKSGNIDYDKIPIIKVHKDLPSMILVKTSYSYQDISHIYYKYSDWTLKEFKGICIEQPIGPYYYELKKDNTLVKI